MFHYQKLSSSFYLFIFVTKPSSEDSSRSHVVYSKLIQLAQEESTRRDKNKPESRAQEADKYCVSKFQTQTHHLLQMSTLISSLESELNLQVTFGKL